MKFRNTYVVRHFGISHTDAPIELKLPDSMLVLLRPIAEEEKTQFREPDDWIATVEIQEEVSPKVTMQFGKLPGVRTPAVDQLVEKVCKRMVATLTKALDICKWRTGILAHHKSIRSGLGGVEWALEGDSWQNCSSWSIDSLSTVSVATPFSSKVWKDVCRLTCKDTGANIAHEILREAWSLRYDSQRSALILAVSALEVGVKEFIADIVPNSEWLCFESPTPPVVRILKEYLPQMPVRARFAEKPVIPSHYLDGIKKMVMKRNRIAHRGASIDLNRNLTDSIIMIQSTLYLLEFYRGHSWALHQVRDTETREFIKDNTKEWADKVGITMC